MKPILVLALAVSVAACATTAPQVAPTPPPASQGAFVGAETLAARSAPPSAGWWRRFADPALDDHVRQALAANADLRMAIANLEAARAGSRLAQAQRLPTVAIESGAGPTRADRQPSTASVPKTGYELGAAGVFEIDLFGRLKAAAQAADAEASAAAADMARIMVVGDTVAAYLDLCGASAGADLLRAQLALQQRSHDLVAEQLAAGEVSPLELSQAASLRDQARAALPQAEADRANALFRLATLRGQAPAALSAAETACTAIPASDGALAIGDGAALIDRRPDVREAEHRLAAATARTRVAVADLYPRIQLGGSGGLLAGGADAFLTPLITWTFPNQAAPRARIAGASATERAALASWDRAVLRALQEVETALSNLRAARDRQSALRLALTESENLVRRARARGRLGADAPLVVIDAERTRNLVANQAVAADLAVVQAEASLYRALGAP